MAAIFQTTFSNAFSWMKMYEFRLKFHWSLFPRVELTIFQHWFIWWLAAVQVTSHYLNQWWLVYPRIYASLGLNELTLVQLWLVVGWYQAITWNHHYSLSIGPLEINFREIYITAQNFSFKKIYMKNGVKWCPVSLDLSVLRHKLVLPQQDPHYSRVPCEVISSSTVKLQITVDHLFMPGVLISVKDWLNTMLQKSSQCPCYSKQEALREYKPSPHLIWGT